jgi:hypothetical protein
MYGMCLALSQEHGKRIGLFIERALKMKVARSPEYTVLAASAAYQQMDFVVTRLTCFVAL